MAQSVLLISLEVCIVMLVFIFTMRSFDSKLRVGFVKLNIAMIVAILSNMITQHVSPIDENIMYLNRIINLVVESYLILEALYMVADFQDYISKLRNALPFFFVLGLSLISPSTHLLFYVDEAGNLVDTPIYWFVYLEFIIYGALIFQHFVQKKHENKKEKCIFIGTLLCMVIAGVIFEKYNIFCNTIIATSVVAIMIMFVYMYAERYNVDSVTYCYKRRVFYGDSEKFGRHNMSVVSMDLNNLKYINDNYGHKAGDEALKTFANICKKAKSSKFILYRTGGDEFMMLGVKATYEETADLIQKIKKDLEATPYTCSYGIAMYGPDDDFEDIVVQADACMYLDKKKFKLLNRKEILNCEEQLSKMYCSVN